MERLPKADQIGGATEPTAQAVVMRATMAEAFASPQVQRGSSRVECRDVLGAGGARRG